MVFVSKFLFKSFDMFDETHSIPPAVIFNGPFPYMVDHRRIICCSGCCGTRCVRWCYRLLWLCHHDLQEFLRDSCSAISDVGSVSEIKLVKRLRSPFTVSLLLNANSVARGSKSSFRREFAHLQLSFILLMFHGFLCLNPKESCSGTICNGLRLSQYL